MTMIISFKMGDIFTFGVKRLSNNFGEIEDNKFPIYLKSSLRCCSLLVNSVANALPAGSLTPIWCVSCFDCGQTQ